MLTSDLLLGWMLSKLFDNKGETRSPAVTFPPAPGTAPPAAPATAPPAAPPATSQPVPPTFPTSVPVPPPTSPTGPTSTVPAGFKKGVEIWIVKPSIAQQASSVLVGAPADVAAVGAAITLQALENQFPSGWQGAKSATPAEAAKAKSLLASWKDGGVVFDGPSTLTGRRAYRMTKHPAAAVPGATPPAPVAPAAAPPAAPAPTVPASFPATPAPAPAPTPRPAAVPSTPGVVTTLPEVLITADAPAAAPAAAPGRLVTAVRKGEGLANVAKRLGRPATAASAVELQQANVPQGPDAQWSKTDLSKGGLKKAGRAGGLQPGDRLFVPASWAVDVSRL